MPPLTHVLAGWCVGNSMVTTHKERLACMAMSCVADLDGLSLLGGREAYQHYHHLLGHNLFFAAASALVASLITRSKTPTACLYFALFHIHLALDLFGSGPGWGFAYFWPFSTHEISTSLVWEYQSWQNFAILGGLLIWTFVIAVRLRRTPFEIAAPRFNALLLRSKPDDVS